MVMGRSIKDSLWAMLSRLPRSMLRKSAVLCSALACTCTMETTSRPGNQQQRPTHDNGHHAAALSMTIWGMTTSRTSTPPPREQGPERFDVGDDPSPATSRQIIALQNISKSNKTDPALVNEIKTLLTTPTEHNGGPPRVSKAKASELISRAFDK